MGFGALIGASYILFGEYVVKGNNWKHFLVIYIKLIQTCGMYFFWKFIDNYRFSYF